MQKKTTARKNGKEQKSKKGQYLLIGLGILVATGTGLYFALRPRANTNVSFDSQESSKSQPIILPIIPTANSGSKENTVSDGFPLKRGSRGQLVKNLQEALITRYGAGILPRYGADGIWGSELSKALSIKGWPDRIDASTFTKLVGSTSKPTKVKFNPGLLATNLRLAILDSNYTKAISSLTKIWKVSGYVKVNNIFKENRIGGVRKTLVNALLTAFPAASQKKGLNAEFHRMGLKFNGSQWSLSGALSQAVSQLKTTRAASVWNQHGQQMTVQSNTILGEFLGAKDGVTSFQSLNNETLFTYTKNISYV